MAEWNHFNKDGRAKMVDITNKPKTERLAKAASSVVVSEEVYESITSGSIKKGDVLAVAQIAAIMGSKRTSELIPMCHLLPLTGVDVSFSWEKHDNKYHLIIIVTVKTIASTGVEMEALTAASISAITVYDMCKAIDKGMIIGPTYLIEKKGGKNGDFKREETISENNNRVGDLE
ncbi:cyclic pyranopterin monophosphate synthase MoaC [Bacillaceae bacterium Marseille-Q3522]|nr:cyclic pyranopterin monophosphate synthase MoaC [Bacillaceae bacterium Marseille-Q3522]